jgi:hypothetical protein
MTIISFLYITYLSVLLVQFGIILFEILQKRYPEQFQRFIIDFSFGCIYLFSRFQIFVVRLNNNLNKFIDENPLLLKIKNNINKILTKNNNESITLHYENYKFCVQNYVKDGLIYKKIIYDENIIPSSFEQCEIKFMLIEFCIGDKNCNKYKIDLKTSLFDFYLVGNKFTKEFFIFYIKIYLNISDNINNDDKCYLKIIDHDINSVCLEFNNENDSIILEKNGYKLISTNHSDKE